MAALRWLCPGCHHLNPRWPVCTCGTRPTPLAAPGQTPAVVAHLTMLDDGPAPADMLAGACDGNHRYPLDPATASHTACRQHDRRSVWLWQATLEDLIELEEPEEDSEESSTARTPAPKAGAFGITNLMLIEPYGVDPHFRARYFRQRQTEPPNLSDLLDGLSDRLSNAGGRLRAIALLDPMRNASEQENARLRNACSRFETFTDRGKALSWLLGTPLDMSVPIETDPKLDPSRIGLYDVGGILSRELLAWLCWQTFKASRDLEKTDWVKLSGAPLGWGWQPWAHSTHKVRDLGRVHQIRRSVPAPADPLPVWSAELRRWRTAAHTIQIAAASLAQDEIPATGSTPLVVTIGSARQPGERHLADLQESSWHGRATPVAVVKDNASDPRLVRWIRQSFPALPVRQATDAGLRRAIRKALARCLDNRAAA